MFHHPRPPRSSRSWGVGGGGAYLLAGLGLRLAGPATAFPSASALTGAFLITITDTLAGVITNAIAIGIYKTCALALAGVITNAIAIGIYKIVARACSVTIRLALALALAGVITNTIAISVYKVFCATRSCAGPLSPLGKGGRSGDNQGDQGECDHQGDTKKSCVHNRIYSLLVSILLLFACLGKPSFARMDSSIAPEYGDVMERPARLCGKGTSA